MLKVVVHLAVGVRGLATSIVMVMVMLSCVVGLPTPSVTEGGRSHSDGINMPEWNQAH